MPPNSKYRNHSSPSESPASCLNVSNSSNACSVMCLMLRSEVWLPSRERERFGPIEEGLPTFDRLTQKVGEGIILIEAFAFHDDSLGCRDDLSTAQGFLESNSQLCVGDAGTRIGKDPRGFARKDCGCLLIL